MRYLILIEPTATGYSTYSPDVTGCVATGADRPDVEREMRDALAFHIEGLREAGLPIPDATTTAAYVDIQT
jgi:predicted RNase H-like HicB family nuclease